MSRLLALVPTLGAFALADAAGNMRESGARATAACAAKSSKRIFSSGSGRVILKSRKIYACPKSGKNIEMGYQWRPAVSSSGGGGITHVALHRHWAAYVEHYFDSWDNLAGVVVRDVRSGRAAFSRFHGINHGYPEVSDLILCGNGRVAYILSHEIPDQGPTPGTKNLEVRLSKGRHTVLLDHGPNIVNGSLRASDRYLTWQNADTTRGLEGELPRTYRECRGTSAHDGRRPQPVTQADPQRSAHALCRKRNSSQIGSWGPVRRYSPFWGAFPRSSLLARGG